MGEDDFAEAYRRLSAPILRFAAGRLSPDQAKDVVHDTFEVVWRKRDECPDDPDQWAAWIVGIARKKILQELDRTQRKHHDGRFIADQTIGAESDPEPDVADLVTASDTGRWVLTQLNDNERELLDLAFIERLDPEHGAQALGLSPSAYASRISRLRRRIQDLTAAHAAATTTDDTDGTP